MWLSREGSFYIHGLSLKAYSKARERMGCLRTMPTGQKVGIRACNIAGANAKSKQCIKDNLGDFVVFRTGEFVASGKVFEDHRISKSCVRILY